ncbi:MAG TPA: hypothetical protein VF088_09340 [Pyrinomonadaceae bacterium]
MRNKLMKSVLALSCLAIILVPLPASAQSSTAMYISVNPTTVLAGEWARVTGVVMNNSTSKLRITVTFAAVDPCGTKMDLGYNRLALNPGEQVLITTAYPTSVDSCRGTHTVTMSSGGGKGKTAAASPSATAYLEVQ